MEDAYPISSLEHGSTAEIEQNKNGDLRGMKEAVPVYCAASDGVRVMIVHLTNAKNKRVRIVEYEDAKDDPEFRSAMRKELSSFQEFECVKEMSYSMLPKGANVISTRWVLYKKTNSDGTISVKARLLARGFEYMGRATATFDAPTASAAAQRLVLAALVEKQWIPQTWDFKTAFPQGNELKRDVWIVPLPNLLGTILYGNY